ncbi:MAG: hypothetical protein H0U32_12890, partial [Thermoleophilaceae bacterium]|nr:hypothetical protein [Thermoleophilaceae bacterium]
YRSARDRLAGDEAREILGFSDPRNRGGRVIHLRDGIPSEASVSRHKSRFGEATRLLAYGQLFDRLVTEPLDDPAMREEARILDIDGSHILTHYTCPKTNRGRVTNEKQVTCPDGGFLPPTEQQPGKSGHGFNLVSITTATGLPLAFDVAKINASEKTTATDLLQGQFADLVAPRLDPTKVAVLSGDGGFNAKPLRAAAHELGLVENIHLASHADRDTSRKNVSRRDHASIQIEGYPNWDHQRPSRDLLLLRQGDHRPRLQARRPRPSHRPDRGPLQELRQHHHHRRSLA